MRIENADMDLTKKPALHVRQAPHSSHIQLLKNLDNFSQEGWLCFEVLCLIIIIIILAQQPGSQDPLFRSSSLYVIGFMSAQTTNI